MNDETKNLPNEKNQAYRVLARKYRPNNFDELIGQEALVTTLSNGINKGRIAQAFMLTGVRGVGKTTTARIIAKALNCIGIDGNCDASVNICGKCDNCVAISEDRHVDVMEMDAASHTGIDDIREIIETVRYLPVTARYKIYILDEVHMLSKNAFNALLKTLEEPPEHVKFIFATTEIRKVPITILSRCQRFDLRRVTIDKLKLHYKNIATKENVTIDDDALDIITIAADGSVRDGLSILDQAIAVDSENITAKQLQNMLGLADRVKIFDLFDKIMAGDHKQALEQLHELYNVGGDPIAIIKDLMDVSYWLTRFILNPELENSQSTPDIERVKGKAMAEKLSLPILSRIWQMLLKGLSEAQIAPNSLQAVEMVIIRLIHTSNLPTPEDIIKKATNIKKPEEGGENQNTPSSDQSITVMQNKNLPKQDIEITVNEIHALDDDCHVNDLDKNTNNLGIIIDFRAMVDLFSQRREGILVKCLMMDVNLISFSQGQVKLRTNKNAIKDLCVRMSKLLLNWTDVKWQISLGDEAGDKTLYQQDQMTKQNNIDNAASEPLVKSVRKYFPTVEIIDVIKHENIANQISN